MKVNIHNRVYPVILEEDSEGGFVVSNPAFEGCYSQGDTIEEALKNIREATLLCLETQVKKNMTTEQPRYAGVHLITT